MELIGSIYYDMYSEKAEKNYQKLSRILKEVSDAGVDTRRVIDSGWMCDIRGQGVCALLTVENLLCEIPRFGPVFLKGSRDIRKFLQHQKDLASN